MQLEAIRALPKAEGHIHLGGSLLISHLHAIASETDQKALSLFLERVKGGVRYEDVFGAFALISRIVTSNQKIEDGTFYLCEELKRRDNVHHVEIRSGLKSFDGPGNEEGYLQAILAGIKRAASHQISATVLLSVKRSDSMEFVEKTVHLAKKYMNQGVVGIEISGDSTTGDIRPLIATIQKAKKLGLMLTAHIGESSKETDQMLILSELTPDRVGHAVNLTPTAKDWIKSKKIPVEVCPTSARLCTMHGPDETHPWLREYLDNGHPIIIGSDDPTVFNVTLSEEYDALQKIMGPDAICQLAKTSFDYIFPRSTSL